MSKCIIGNYNTITRHCIKSYNTKLIISDGKLGYLSFLIVKQYEYNIN